MLINALLGIGLAGLAGGEVRRRRKKKSVEKSYVINSFII
jgi:hypothetical protein